MVVLECDEHLGRQRRLVAAEKPLEETDSDRLGVMPFPDLRCRAFELDDLVYRFGGNAPHRFAGRGERNAFSVSDEQREPEFLFKGDDRFRKRLFGDEELSSRRRKIFVFARFEKILELPDFHERPFPMPYLCRRAGRRQVWFSSSAIS